MYGDPRPVRLLLEQSRVTGGVGSPGVKPCVHMWQLDSENRGLERIQAAVVPGFHELIRLGCAVYAQHAADLRHIIMVRGDHAAVASAPQVFAGVKRQRGRRAQAARDLVARSLSAIR